MQEALSLIKNKKSGMTLIELMVATAIFSLIILATTSGSIVGLKEVQRSDKMRLVQNFELAHRIQFLDRIVVKVLAAESEDALLNKCLNSSCVSDCLKQSEWKSVKWGNIDLNRFATDDGRIVNLGSRFKVKKDGLDECSLIKQNGVPIPPYFAPDCNFMTSARWKSGGADTVLIEIQLSDPEAGISRNLRYHVPIEKDPLTQSCQPANAISCGASNVFITKIDFSGETLNCAVAGAGR